MPYNCCQNVLSIDEYIYRETQIFFNLFRELREKNIEIYVTIGWIAGDGNEIHCRSRVKVDFVSTIGRGVFDRINCLLQDFERVFVGIKIYKIAPYYESLLNSSYIGFAIRLNDKESSIAMLYYSKGKRYMKREEK